MASLNTILLVRRGTTEEWTSSSYTLKEGEFGFDTEAKVLKVGDGKSAWDALEPVNLADFNKRFVKAVTEGDSNGTIKVDGQEVQVHGLGTAAYTDSDDYDAVGTAESAVSTHNQSQEAHPDLRQKLTSLQSTVEGLGGQVAGLEGAMHWRGKVAADPTQTPPSLEPEAQKGDVVSFGTKEWAYDGESWIEWGDEGSYLEKTAAEATYAKKSALEEETTAREGLGTRLETAEGNIIQAQADIKKAQGAAEAAQATADAAMPTSGGTFTGDVTLNGAPTEDLHAATKGYVDSKFNAIDVSGDIEAAINDLNVEDTESDGQYVSAVKEVAGKIEVTRKDLPKPTVTNVKASGDNDNIEVTNEGTEFTVKHKTFTTTGPTEQDEVQTSYITKLTVNNGHLTKVESTSLEKGLKALGTFTFDGGKADGTWGE